MPAPHSSARELAALPCHIVSVAAVARRALVQTVRKTLLCVHVTRAARIRPMTACCLADNVFDNNWSSCAFAPIQL